MNLSQLCELKNGDKIVCKQLPAFTTGKTYTVIKTPIGAMVDDDNGIGRYLFDMEHFFEKVADKG